MARPERRRGDVVRGSAGRLYQRIPRRARVAGGVAFAAACAAGAASWIASGCSGWDPAAPFERNAPEVEQAVRELDAGRLESAEEALEEYLGTGPCESGRIGLPDSVRQKPNGAFDLGLVLFYLAERYGSRFGEEEPAAQGPDGQERPPDEQAKKRSAEVDCALIVTKAIASDANVPIDLRARAYYLSGNLEFLRARYEEAVRLYDDALRLVPGVPEEAGGDGIGRDAAYNRAIALRRIEEQKDAGRDADDPDAQDASEPPDASDGGDGSDGEDGSDGRDAQPDGSDESDEGDAGQDGGDDGQGQDGGDGQDAGDDDGKDDDGADGGADGGADASQPQPEQQPRDKPPADPQQDERILDQLEEAPTYQEQEAKQRAGLRRGRAMEDK